MKRTGIKKLELKRLTVKELQEVSGSGHNVQNMTISMTCTCENTAACVIVADENYHACDLVAFGMCDGSCVAPPPSSCGGGCGGCGGGGGE